MRIVTIGWKAYGGSAVSQEGEAQDVSRGRAREFWCSVVSEAVMIRLKRPGGFGRVQGYFVQCKQTEAGNCGCHSLCHFCEPPGVTHESRHPMRRLHATGHSLPHGGPDMAPKPPAFGAPRGTRGAPLFRVCVVARFRARTKPGHRREPRNGLPNPQRSERPWEPAAPLSFA